MTGDELKKRLKGERYSITDLAEKLGMTRPNLSQALSVKDVKTGLVEDLARVLNLPITFFYEGTDFEKERKAVEDSDKDREILYLRGQVAAYEKALGISRAPTSEKANVG